MSTEYSLYISNTPVHKSGPDVDTTSPRDRYIILLHGTRRPLRRPRIIYLFLINQALVRERPEL